MYLQAYGTSILYQITLHVNLKVYRIYPMTLEINFMHYLKKTFYLANCLVVTEQHAGLIGHMASCTAFKDQLVDYDLIIKWRWDLAMILKDFESIVDNYIANPHTVITDNISVSEGFPIMNEVAFAANPYIMLSIFTPVEEKFLYLGQKLQMDVMEHGNKLRVGGLFSHARLVNLSEFQINTVPFKWALLRKNILDNLDYLNCQDIDRIASLQQRSDRIKDFELKKINSSTLRSV